MTVRAQLRRILRRLGLFRRQSQQPTLHPSFAALRKMAVSPEAGIRVIDVGAHEGLFADSWLKWKPESTVMCFEPQPAIYERLVRRFSGDARVTCFPFAAGRQNSSAEMRIHEYTETASFLEMTPQLANAAPELAIREVGRALVSVVCLDTFCKTPTGHVDLLKIDVQGFEMEVLCGAVELLRRVNYVFIEVSFAELYRGAPSFYGIYEWMAEHGFYLVTIVPHDYLEGDRLLEADFLFRRAATELR